MRLHVKKTVVLGVVLLLAMTVFCTAAWGGGGNPAAHWKFDGDFKDASGNGYDATKVGVVNFADDGVMGKCAWFKGGFLEVASAPGINFKGNFTVSAWVKTDPDAEVRDTSYFFSKPDPKGNNSSFAVSGSNTGRNVWATMVYGNPYGEAKVSLGGTNLKEKWTHLAVVSDGRYLYLYADGVLKKTDELPKKGIFDSSPGILVGKGGFGNNIQVCQGLIDDLRVYNYAMDENAVAALYNEAGATTNVIELKMEDWHMMVDGQKKEIDPGRKTCPVNIDGRTLVPIRAIIETMGGSVQWFGDDRRVEVSLKDKTLKLWIDNTSAYLGDTRLTLDVPPMIIDDRTMLPLRFVGEKLGSKVEWDGAARKITIRYAK